MNNSTSSISEDTLISFTQSRHYVETVYLQTNLHDHYNNINGTSNISNDKKHVVMLEWLFNKVLSKGEFKGCANSREWYELGNYKVGVLTDYDKSIKSNWYTVVIQYKQSHLWTLKDDLKGIELPLSNERSLYKFNRADVTCIYKSETDYLNGYGVISKYRKKSAISKNGIVETVYLGTRSGGNMVRWYNKTIELKANEDYKKIETLSSYFGDIESLYTVELEMNRDYLLRTMGIDTLDDVHKLTEAYQNIIGSMRVYELTEDNEKLLKSNHSSRIRALRFSVWVDYKRLRKKTYKPSKEYLVDRLERSSNRYIESMNITAKDEASKELLSIVNSLLRKLCIDADNDLVISYEQSIASLELEQMREKHERLRDVGNDLLIVEAKKAFKGHIFNGKNKDIVSTIGV